MKSWLILIYGLLIGLLVTGAILLIAQPRQGAAIDLLPAPSHTITLPPSPTKTPQPVTVQIFGQVTNPGVYTLFAGARLNDLILMAGGLSIGADQIRVNLASQIRDGDYFYIPGAEEPIPETATNAPQNRSQETIYSYPLNLNETSQEALESLPGIGPEKAAEIIAYRDTYGAFSSVDELIKVPGIGEATLNSLRDYLLVEP